MSADIQFARLVQLIWRIVWVSRTLERTIPSGKMNRVYTLKLQRCYAQLESEFGYTRSDLHQFIVATKLSIDGEPVQDWLI